MLPTRISIEGRQKKLRRHLPRRLVSYRAAAPCRMGLLCSRKPGRALFPISCYLPEYPLKGDKKNCDATCPEDWSLIERQPLVGWDCCVAVNQAGQFFRSHATYQNIH